MRVRLKENGKRFSDTQGHWAANAIDFAVARELFAGTTATEFNPEGVMTRGMLMTVLARFDGEDTTGGSTWYEKGMNWAKAKGISDGTNPDGAITREQRVTMLYRYADNATARGSLEGYADADQVSEYAVDAMRWAVKTGLISGMSDGTLAPQGGATRAQVATILMRFCENLVRGE